MFIKIQSLDGSCHHIKTDQISLVMKDVKNQCWIVIGQHSIQIGEHQHNQLITKFNEWWNVDEIKRAPVPLLDKIKDLELSVRTANCLYNSNIEYIHQLLKLTQTDLLKMKNMGRKSLNEIKEILKVKYDAELGELKC